MPPSAHCPSLGLTNADRMLDREEIFYIFPSTVGAKHTFLQLEIVEKVHQSIDPFNPLHSPSLRYIARHSQISKTCSLSTAFTAEHTGCGTWLAWFEVKKNCEQLLSS